MSEGGLREKAERGEAAEHAHEAGGDGGDGRGLGDGDPRPGVEEGGKVAIGLADEGVLAADPRAKGGDLGVAHGAEEREQTADDPDCVDGATRPVAAIISRGHEKNSGADDDADDDGDRVARGEDAREIGGGVGGHCHGGSNRPGAEDSIAANSRSVPRPNRTVRRACDRGGDRRFHARKAWRTGCRGRRRRSRTGNLCATSAGVSWTMAMTRLTSQP